MTGRSLALATLLALGLAACGARDIGPSDGGEDGGVAQVADGGGVILGDGGPVVIGVGDGGQLDGGASDAGAPDGGM